MSFTPSDPADFTPSMGAYKTLQPFRYWCQKVLPLVYDDSLSYYELLCKVIDYLNKTMEDVETLHTDVDNLHDSYDELQTWVNTNYTALVTFVNNYFDNLNVQEEINNKLDEMAEDGTLDALLLPYFNTYKTEINGIVSTQNSKIEVLEGRMDEFASLPDGSTSGDAELIDIRIGANGTIYPSAGDAVRGQYTELNSNFIEGLEPITDTLSVHKEITGNVVKLNGSEVNSIVVTPESTFSKNNSNLFDLTFTQGATFPTGQSVTISGTSITVEAEESRRYQTVWFEVPEGKALIGQYVSAKCGTPTSVSTDITPSCGLAWLDSNNAITAYIINLTSGNNYVYNNKLVQAPSDPNAKMIVFCQLTQGNFSTVGDHATFNDIQINLGINVTSYEEGSTRVYNRIARVYSEGDIIILSEDGCDVNYGLYIDLINSVTPLYQKKVLIVGDSISTGPSSNKRIPGTNYGNYDKWVDWLIKRNQLDDNNTYNESIHASGYVATNEGYPDNTFLYRLQNMSDKDTFDTVIIFGGINDFIQNVNFDTFKSAVDNTLLYAINNYTQARIVIISPTRSWNLNNNNAGKKVLDYCNYIIEAAKSLSLPVIDATYESGFCPFIDTFKAEWTNLTGDTPDGLHPNADYMEKYLSWYLHKALNMAN